MRVRHEQWIPLIVQANTVVGFNLESVPGVNLLQLTSISGGGLALWLGRKDQAGAIAQYATKDMKQLDWDLACAPGGVVAERTHYGELELCTVFAFDNLDTVGYLRVVNLEPE